MNFRCLSLSPKAPLDFLMLLGKVWVLALPRMSTHLSHLWTSLVLKSVGDVDYARPPFDFVQANLRTLSDVTPSDCSPDGGSVVYELICLL